MMERFLCPVAATVGALSDIGTGGRGRGGLERRGSGGGEVCLDGVADDGAGGGAVLLDVGGQGCVSVLGQADLAARGASAPGGVGLSEAWAASEDGVELGVADA